jgi:anti-anti-sigma regulatory factor
MNAFQLETTDSSALVRLDGELTIEEAGALRVALRTALRRPRELVLDPSALVRIDVAALQVLLAAARAAASVRVAPAPAPAWTAALERYALGAAFAQS